MSDTDCDDGVDRVEPDIPGSDDPTRDLGETWLIVDPTTKVQRTVHAECDPHSAITRGLAEYLAALEDEHVGRRLKFTRVIADWPEQDDQEIQPPAATVHSEEEGRYSDVPQNYSPSAKDQVGAERDGVAQYVVSAGNYELIALHVEILCGDKEERRGVRMMCERAFRPVEWNAGFRLVLPHYHNAIATFSLTGGQFADTEETAQANAWPIIFTLRAWVPAYRVHSLPLAKPRTKGTIVTP